MRGDEARAELLRDLERGLLREPGGSSPRMERLAVGGVDGDKRRRLLACIDDQPQAAGMIQQSQQPQPGRDFLHARRRATRGRKQTDFHGLAGLSVGAAVGDAVRPGTQKSRHLEPIETCGRSDCLRLRCRPRRSRHGRGNPGKRNLGKRIVHVNEGRPRAGKCVGSHRLSRIRERVCRAARGLGTFECAAGNHTLIRKLCRRDSRWSRRVGQDRVASAGPPRSTRKHVAVGRHRLGSLVPPYNLRAPRREFLRQNSHVAGVIAGFNGPSDKNRTVGTTFNSRLKLADGKSVAVAMNRPDSQYPRNPIQNHGITPSA